MHLVYLVTSHPTSHLKVFLDKEPPKNQPFVRGGEKRFKGAIRQFYSGMEFRNIIQTPCDLQQA